MPPPTDKELDVLIRARYPLIYLVSWEERRAETMLGNLAVAHGKQVFFWSVTQGIYDGKNTGDKQVKDPQAALDFIDKSEQQALFVLKDFHAFMGDAGVIRRMRDLVQRLKSSYKTILILSPVLTLPTELEKDLTVVDYALPDAAEVGALLEEIIAASKSGTRFAVDLKPGDKERLIQSALGMTLSEAENAFARAVITNSKLAIENIDVILQETKQIIRKSRLLEYFEAKEDVGQIGGLDLLKDWLQKRGHAFSDKAREFGLPQPKGVMLLGVQGCGKSMTCKAISSLWRLPLLRLDMGSIFGGIVGQSEENMRKAIKTAESVAPCILWLDEIEKGLSGTQSSNVSDAGTTARVFSTFLTWLQEKTAPVFVAATANNISLLPPELLRKGRLDEIFFIDLPSHAERREIFSIHLKRKKRDPSRFNLDELATITQGFSGAEIEQAVVSAMYEAFNQGKDIDPAFIEQATRATVPLSKTMQEEIERLRQWAASRARPASTTAAASAGNGFARRLEI